MQYEFTNINNDNVNEIARIVLQRILDGKIYYEKDFKDIFVNENEHIRFMELLKDCRKIDNCSFVKPLNGQIYMTTLGGIEVTKKGIGYLNNPNEYIFL